MKPMLSATCDDIKLLTYPLMASPKLDGIRAIVDPELGVVSRNLKPIRNDFVRERFSVPFLEGLDGELILGAHDTTVFRRTTSAVSAFEGCPDVTFWVFDVQGVRAGFQERYEYLMSNVHGRFKNVKVVPHQFIKNHVELAVYEESCLAAGYEGIMVRSLDGAYKEGRATVREGSLLKVKRFADAEAEIIGFEERMHNGNEATKDALGRTERSSHQANMVGRGDLGALVVRGINGPYAGVEFNIGTGFDDWDRSEIWETRDAIKGQVVKYKYFPMGSKDAPRFPVYLGMRPEGI